MRALVVEMDGEELRNTKDEHEAGAGRERSPRKRLRGATAAIWRRTGMRCLHRLRPGIVGEATAQAS